MSPTLAHHPHQHSTNTTHHSRQHASHASTPPTALTIAQIACHLSNYLGPIKLLKLFGLKFQAKIWQFLLLIFIFAVFTFQVFLSIFIKMWKTAIEKLYFFRGNQSALFKRRLFFQKQIRNIFRKNCFLILVPFWPFWLYNSLLKMNYLYYQF